MESSDGTPCTLAGTGPSASCTVSLNPAAAGAHTIGATFAATSVHTTSTDSKTLTVTTRHTTTTVSLTPASVVVNQPSSVPITVTDDDTHGTPLTPSGPITLSNSGSEAFLMIRRPPRATRFPSTTLFRSNPAAAGAHTIGATFAATSVHSTSTASATLTVTTRHTTTTVSLS